MRIDLNSDMGESFGRWKLGDDHALLDVVSSANVACGFHAGDPAGMLRTLSDAAANGVCVGAHVAYHDLDGFGRRFVDEQPADLTADVMYQIAALEGLAASVGTKVSYVKPHGALYNRIVHDRKQAQAVVEAIIAVDPSLALLTLPGSVAGELATNTRLQVFREAFADRAYMPDGTLVPRTQDGAVIGDVDTVAARVAAHGVQRRGRGDRRYDDHGARRLGVGARRQYERRRHGPRHPRPSDADGFDVASFIQG